MDITNQTLAATITGWPAAIIIIVVLALIAIGIYTVVKKGARKARGRD